MLTELENIRPQHARAEWFSVFVPAITQVGCDCDWTIPCVEWLSNFIPVEPAKCSCKCQRQADNQRPVHPLP